jgi:hypothetical protein
VCYYILQNIAQISHVLIHKNITRKNVKMQVQIDWHIIMVDYVICTHEMYNYAHLFYDMTIFRFLFRRGWL